MYVTAQRVNNNNYYIYDLVTKIFTTLKGLSVEINVYSVPFQMFQLSLNGTQSDEGKDKQLKVITSNVSLVPNSKNQVLLQS